MHLQTLKITITILVLWELCSFTLGEYRFPHIFDTLQVFANSIFHESTISSQSRGATSGYMANVLWTVFHYSAGMVSGVVLGFVLAISLFQSKLLLAVLHPFIDVLRILPPLIFIPFSLIILGPTTLSQIAIATAYAFYSMFIYTINGLNHYNLNLGQLSDLLGGNSWHRIVKVQSIAILPEIVGGIRLISAMTFGIVIVGEYLGAPVGIGRVLKFAVSHSNVKLIFVGIIWSTITIGVADFLLTSLADRLLTWSNRRYWQLRNAET